MSSPTPRQNASFARQAAIARQRPAGWPVGSFSTYEEAQRAVDGLSDKEFPVAALTIVGVDLMEVESVTGRLTWGRVLAGGAASGAWTGVFVGLLLGIFMNTFFGPLLAGLAFGAVFGLVMAAVPYAMTQGRRDFTSATTIVAGRYDLLCDPQLAPQARDFVATLTGNTAPTQQDDSGAQH
ncbi:general stress protein [Corynebacterium uberis]|uniref:general stress protein n=1 Tax=Corynebacterium TaxID=1716 RepID=UPI001D0A5AC6|nr:general stress protein [Corynebacterium uberis]MCZ9308972.1 magnesium transporter [Corynebacterium sp. c6VSa_13]UDL74557.1 magnesium transporter [Corynebacterium uberis]UDL78822.1 magnesium transporter [Corynebacterium uberis]UDL81100.1 magnesium transporter [Corynebacterium uberis]UDL83239.1 magnesium transporter [Corynebacterium uberis]